MPTELKGAIELRKAFKKVDPILAKETEKEIRVLLRNVAIKARGFVPSESPLSGWGNAVGSWENRVFSSSDIRRGIGYSTSPSKPNKRGFRSLATIFNKSAAGAIYETAGRLNAQGLPPAKNVRGYLGGAFGKGPIGDVRETGRGVNKSSNPKAGRQFIDSMPPLVDSQQSSAAGRRTRKTKGRLLFRAWAYDQGKTNAAVLKAIEKSMDTALAVTKGASKDYRGR